ncbi:AAA family ATPase [Robertkochia sediminum]|uniref:AAA family ATPase n=1 Tax=Robertkochia sediminum TaxID=2785326 RepID=UPI0019333AE7|nr:AAA family ATPase [Robertkochia sediminum]MBL7472221.1 EVE domain-containing protein [Robertkochia sediminum]
MRDEKFSWVETHNKINEYLSAKEHSQQEIIELLKSVGIGPFNDKAAEGEHDIELDEIDPFTFYCYIYKYGAKNRLKYLQKIAETLDIEKPADVSGVPSAQAQKVWLFPYKMDRTNNEISRLWKLFNKERRSQITNDDFKDVLLIKNVARTRLTEALFYINPEKYLPINGPIKAYFKEVLGIDPKFNSYDEYLEVLTQVKEKSDLPFYQLSFEAWNWNNERKQVNYWVFQGNPKVFDFETSIRERILTDWTVSAHKDKIKVGDKVILWITGDQAGCYALAEVTSEPHPNIASPDDHLWKGEDTSALKAGIRITHNFVDHPVLSEYIKGVEELNDLKVGNQGTNFSATEEEYQAILELSQSKTDTQYWLYAPGENAHLWDECYQQGIMALGWDEIGDLRQFENRHEIKKALVAAYGGSGSKKNDVTANDEFLNKIKVGDVVIAKKGRGELLGFGIVSSDCFFDKDRTNYQNIRKVDWKLKGNWKLDFSLVVKTLTDITKYSSEHPDFNTFYERLLGIMGQSIKTEKEEAMIFPLNTILYGPPGTGKTYNTVLRAAEIIENRKIDSYDEALKIFKANLHDQIEFITFHQNYSYEDFIQGLRPDTENGTQLTFERKDGVFKVIADRALKNLEDSYSPKAAKRPFEEVFNEFVSPLVEGEVEEIEVKMKKVSYFITAVTNKSIDFRKASGGSAHTLSIATLKRMYSAESVLDIQGLASYYAPLLDSLLDLGKDTSGKMEATKRKDYVIIIDEINRANISRVFGELITLIEPDKRSHGNIPMKAKLPSGDNFIVPSNLYIIGTMNTADKSIALLDIALRRRFEFEPMYPKYSEDGLDVKDENVLRSINDSISSDKGPDFQIGHSYFMDSKDDPYNFMRRMNVKVIPLLLEYFMNDKEAVTRIVSKALEGTGYSTDHKNWPLRISESND